MGWLSVTWRSSTCFHDVTRMPHAHVPLALSALKCAWLIMLRKGKDIERKACTRTHEIEKSATWNALGFQVGLRGSFPSACLHMSRYMLPTGPSSPQAFTPKIPQAESNVCCCGVPVWPRSAFSCLPSQGQKAEKKRQICFQ